MGSPHGVRVDHLAMVIDMNEAQVRTVEEVREVLQGAQELEFRVAQDDAGRYAWIGAVLQLLNYTTLRRGDRGVVLVYLQRLSSYSRSQVTRLVPRWMSGQLTLSERYRAPAQAFQRRYTPADVALLAEVDRAMDTLSGPATACVLQRRRDAPVKPNALSSYDLPGPEADTAAPVAVGPASTEAHTTEPDTPEPTAGDRNG